MEQNADTVGERRAAGGRAHQRPVRRRRRSRDVSRVHWGDRRRRTTSLGDRPRQRRSPPASSSRADVLRAGPPCTSPPDDQPDGLLVPDRAARPLHPAATAARAPADRSTPATTRSTTARRPTRLQPDAVDGLHVQERRRRQTWRALVERADEEADGQGHDLHRRQRDGRQRRRPGTPCSSTTARARSSCLARSQSRTRSSAPSCTGNDCNTATATRWDPNNAALIVVADGDGGDGRSVAGQRDPATQHPAQGRRASRAR